MNILRKKKKSKNKLTKLRLYAGQVYESNLKIIRRILQKLSVHKSFFSAKEVSI